MAHGGQARPRDRRHGASGAWEERRRKQRKEGGKGALEVGGALGLRAAAEARAKKRAARAAGDSAAARADQQDSVVPPPSPFVLMKTCSASLDGCALALVRRVSRRMCAAALPRRRAPGRSAGPDGARCVRRGSVPSSSASRGAGRALPPGAFGCLAGRPRTRRRSWRGAPSAGVGWAARSAQGARWWWWGGFDVDGPRALASDHGTVVRNLTGPRGGPAGGVPHRSHGVTNMRMPYLGAIGMTALARSPSMCVAGVKS